MSNQRLDETGNRDPNKRLLQDDLERNNSSSGNGTLIGIAFVILILAVMVLMYRANTEEVVPASMSSSQGVATDRSNAAVTQGGTASQQLNNNRATDTSAQGGLVNQPVNNNRATDTTTSTTTNRSGTTDTTTSVAPASNGSL